MLSFSIRAWTWAEITLDRREVTTAVNSTGAGAVLTTRAWVASVGLGSVGNGAGAPHAAIASSAAERDRINAGRAMGELRGVRVLRRGDQACVQAACGEELLVIALLDDLALVHHDDQVGVAHGREPVGDGDPGAAQPLEVLD